MRTGLLARKLGMSRLYHEDGAWRSCYCIKFR